MTQYGTSAFGMSLPGHVATNMHLKLRILFYNRDTDKVEPLVFSTHKTFVKLFEFRVFTTTHISQSNSSFRYCQGLPTFEESVVP